MVNDRPADTKAGGVRNPLFGFTNIEISKTVRVSFIMFKMASLQGQRPRDKYSLCTGHFYIAPNVYNADQLIPLLHRGHGPDLG